MRLSHPTWAGRIACLAFAAGVVAGVAARPVDAIAGVDKSCHKKEFVFAEVRQLCSDETKGRPAVMSMMAKVTGKANARGTKVTCASCHTDQREYDLRPNAVADLRALLEH
jgi:hypothetical protein